MKTRLYVNFGALFSTLLVLSIGCGRVEKDPVYDPAKKQFGRGQEGEEEETGPDDISSPEVSGTSTKEEKEKESGEFSDLEISPNQLVFYSSFRGKILGDRLRFIYRPPFYSPVLHSLEDARSLNRKYGKEVQILIKSPIKLEAKQTYGDGHKSLFAQSIDSPTDVGSGTKGLDFFEGDSESGTQVFDRMLSPADCPKDYVCIGRTVSYPRQGNPKTFCYIDARTNKVTSFPIGSSPGVKKEDLYKAPRRLGPYIVNLYNSANVDCEKTLLKPIKSTRVQVIFSILENSSEIQRINAEKNLPAKASFGLAVEIVKLEGRTEINANLKDYVDSLIGMQARSVFYFSENSEQLVRIVKTIRKPLSSKFAFTGYKGIVAEVEFEFCKDLLFEDSINYCELEK